MPFQWPLRSCSPGSAARDPGLLRPPGPVSSSLARLEEIWARADSDAASSCVPSSYSNLWSSEGMYYIRKVVCRHMLLAPDRRDRGQKSERAGQHRCGLPCCGCGTRRT